jgi:glucose-1-phosphate adenylyltransferase
MHDCQVGTGAYLDRVIIDKKVRIGKQARIVGQATLPNREFPGHLKEGLTLIGKGASIPSTSKIQGNTIIYPGVEEGDFKSLVAAEGETVRKR